MPTAKTDQIRAFVAGELEKNPTAPSTEIFASTRKKFRGLATLTPRQFNAKYVLPVKRVGSAAASGDGSPGTTKAKKPSRKRARKATRKPAPKPASKSAQKGAKKARRAPAKKAASKAAQKPTQSSSIRERVTAELERLVRDVTAAEGRNDLVSVVLSLDTYAERILAGVTRA